MPVCMCACVSVLWEHDCGCFLFSQPLEGAHITSLWASERHTLYKYTPLKGLWGTRYTHTHTHTVQAVVSPLPIKPSNGCLCFYLIGASLKTGSKFSKKSRKVQKKVQKNVMLNSKYIPPPYCLPYLFHTLLVWLLWTKWIQFVIHSGLRGAEGGIFECSTFWKIRLVLSLFISQCFLYNTHLERR